MVDPVAQAVEKRSEILSGEFREHLRELLSKHPDWDEHRIFQGWAIQKIAGLQWAVERLAMVQESMR
jgi:hypothetical protein